MIGKRFLATVTVGVALSVAVAPMASAFQYLISPYFSNDVSSYKFGMCATGAYGAGSANLTVYVVEHNACYMDIIGGRAVDSNGSTTQITWDWNRDDVVHLNRPQGVAKYKIYKSIGDL